MRSEQEKNKALVRRFVEAQWEKDLSALEEILAPTSSTTVSSPARALPAKISCKMSPRTRPLPPTPN